ncbi:MAG: I78 family peptidase inhibitor [Novosphingobium aromaticivorans]|nr:I78 family peptidase inhibitor [Novosphingobium aromaticivorans]
MRPSLLILTLAPALCALSACGAPPAQSDSASASGPDMPPDHQSPSQPPISPSPISPAPIVAPPASDDPAAHDCNKPLSTAFIGLPESPRNRAALVAAVGHHPVRWVHPGDAITMDYQPGRLNVILDETGRIVATRCG